MPLGGLLDRLARLRQHALHISLRRLAIHPFAVRRASLSLLFHTVGRHIVGRPDDRLVAACAQTLGLSSKDSCKFLYRSLLHDGLFQMEWLALGSRSKPGLLADARHIAVDDPDKLTWLAAQQGALIATMHFGPYSLALVWLLHRYFQGRQVLIVKSQTEDPDEARAIARLRELGAHVEFLSPDEPQAFHQMVKRLRQGALGIILIDLPPSYGRSDPVQLFGHQLHIATGGADLAALSGVPIMLFRVRARLTGDILETGDLFHVGRRDDASRTRAVARMTRFIAASVRDYPDHWHMWSRFGEYLPVPRGSKVPA